MMSLSFLLCLGTAHLRAQTFLRGDATPDGELNLTDALSILGCQFLGAKCPDCMKAADTNDSGEVSLTDGIFLLQYLFGGEAAPPAPFPNCGKDPTPDGLACVSPRACAQFPEVEKRDAESLVKRIPTRDVDGGKNRDPKDESVGPVAPVEENTDLSRLHYDAVADRSPRRDLPDGDEEETLERKNGAARYRTAALKAPQWNSPLARKQSYEYLQVDQQAFTAVVHAHEAHTGCTTPDFYRGGSKDQPYGVTIAGPYSAFASEADAESFLADLHPRMPFYLPFKHSGATLWQGWLYNKGTLHTAIDYGRSADVEEGDDPTFGVYAIAAGTVVAVQYHASAGNVVVIEHTAPDGTKYLSRYMHLRNGSGHDRLRALLDPCEGYSADATDRCEKYKKFAQDYPGHVAWGTNAQTIAVHAGDTVSALQFIGWAGNTGVGAGARALNDDGSPTNHRVNNHLHFSLAVEHPTEPDTFVTIDPYGVYGQADTGCYDLLQDTPFARFFAPFFPTFHQVPIEIYSAYANYYIKMDRTLQTRCIHRDANELLVSGSFQSGIPGAWKARSYMTVSTLQDRADEFYADGFIMRETNVTIGAGGEPRYSCIWRKLAAGESIVHRAAMSPGQWSDNWQDLVVDGPYTIEDYFGYRLNGQERRSALYTTSIPGGFYSHRNLTSSEMQDVFDVRVEDGYFPTSFSATEFPGGIRYTGMFHKVSGCWKLYWGRTSAQYQSIASANLAKGYRLHRIQGYADSTRYLAIFKRSAVNGECP